MDENIGRTMLIMLSLCVVSILVAVMTLAIMFIFMVVDADSNLATFDYQIQSSTGEKILNDVVKDVEKDFEIFGIPEVECGYMVDSDENYISTILDGIQIEKAINLKIINIDKEKDIELNDNEVIITSKIANKFNLKKDQEFEYYGRNGEKNILKVKYIVNTLQYLSSFEIITNEATYLQITGKDEISYTMLVGNCKEENSQIKEIIDEYETEYGLKFDEYNDNIAEMIKEILYPSIIVLILVFAVIYVSLNSIVKIIINERISVMGTFRSIGATKKQIIGILVVEMLMYTIIPSLLGSIIGVSAFKGISSFVEAMLIYAGLNEKINILSYLWKISLITILVTIAFQMLLSIVELIKVSRLSIKDTIFNKHTSTYKYSIEKVILGLFLFIIGIITVIKHNQLNYWYCLIGILSIFISIALIVPVISRWLIKLLEKSKNPVINMATNTLKNSSLQINTNIIFIVTVSVSLIIYSFFNYMYFVEKSKQNMVNSDIYVEEMGIQIYDKTDEFYKLDNVKSVSALYDITVDESMYDNIKLADHTIDEIHMVYSNDYENLFKDSNTFNVDANLCENLKKYEIVLSDYYKRIYNLKQGDTVVLNWQQEEENFTIDTPINLKIVEFADLSKLDNNAMIISSDLGEELKELIFKGFSDTKYFINLNDNSSTASKETRKQIINELGIYSNGTTGNVFTKEGYIKSVKETSENYMKFMAFIVAVVVLLALVGIINNQTVSFMERRKEFAILYSVAMSREQLKNMILIENTLAFVNSSIASILFYVIISKLVEYTLQILLIPISMKFTITGILVVLIIVAMILLVIQRSMRKHIKNMNIVEEIKYE
jgi:putative ABC transport system permease protein